MGDLGTFFHQLVQVDTLLLISTLSDLLSLGSVVNFGRHISMEFGLFASWWEA